MTMFLRSLICASLSVFAVFSAKAEDLVTALSAEQVSIQSNFTGTEIVIFGQVGRDLSSISRPGKYDLVILVVGPAETVTTRRKGRFLGVWVNRDSERFQNVPSFYALASTAPVGGMSQREVLDEYGIGLNHLNLAIARGSSVPLSDRDDFRMSFLRLRQEQGLYSERPESIEFLTDTMFRTTVPLPANIPVGAYQIKSFLFQDGVLLSKRQQGLTVAKTGFEQITYSLAHDYSAVYGVIAVILAIFTGWLAGVIFRRD